MFSGERDAKGRFKARPKLPEAKPFVFGGFGEDDRKFLRSQVLEMVELGQDIRAANHLHLTELRTWRKRRTGRERLIDFAAGALVVATVAFLAHVFALHF